MQKIQDEYNRAISLVGLQKYQEAEIILKELSAKISDNLVIILTLANTLHMEKKYEEAISLYLSTSDKFSSSPLFWNNYGVTLIATGNYKDASLSFQRALKLDHNLHTARVSLATCYHNLALFEQAKDECMKVIAKEPENPDAHWNLALIYLLEGNYSEGFREYEWRWKRSDFTSPKRDFQKPLWRGEEAKDKIIFVHAEQGFGDSIQFCRYLPPVADRAYKVIFEAHKETVSIIKSVDKRVEVISKEDKIPDFDLHTPLMSLPYIFSTTLDNIPNKRRYLTVSAEKLAKWEKYVGSNKTSKRIGICWRGKDYPDPRRSIKEDKLSLLKNLKAASIYSLQINGGRIEGLDIVDLTSKIEEFEDTAALILQLDLVISIDTSTAHLAAALGVETKLLLPFIPDWRWMLERNDSPWYPTMKIYRQNADLCWEKVLQDVVADIK